MDPRSGQIKVLIRKKFSRTQLLAYTANLPSSLIGLEACAGAHFIGTALREQGHKVRLIPVQFVKPYRKSDKNDFIDAEAIAEAVTKENMRFVQIKTEEQLVVQAMHRVRDRLVQRRTRCPGLDLVSPGVPKTAGGNFLFEFSHRRHDHLFAFDLMTPSVTFGVPSSERAVGRTLSDLRLGSNNHLPFHSAAVLNWVRNPNRDRPPVLEVARGSVHLGGESQASDLHPELPTAFRVLEILTRCDGRFVIQYRH